MQNGTSGIMQGLSTFPITSRQLDHQKPLHNKKELAL